MPYFFTSLVAKHEQSDYKGHDSFEEQGQPVGIYSQQRIYFWIDVKNIDVGKQWFKSEGNIWRDYNSIEFLIEIIPHSSKSDADRQEDK